MKIDKVEDQPLWQLIMNRCYNMWQNELKDLSYSDFIDSLDSLDAKIVVLGNLNYQVENGGFFQWDDNKYSDQYELVIEALNEINTATSRKAAYIVESVVDDIDSEDSAKKSLDKLTCDSKYQDLEGYFDDFTKIIENYTSREISDYDKSYYEISDELKNDVESWIKKTKFSYPDLISDLI